MDNDRHVWFSWTFFLPDDLPERLRLGARGRRGKERGEGEGSSNRSSRKRSQFAGVNLTLQRAPQETHKTEPVTKSGRKTAKNELG